MKTLDFINKEIAVTVSKLNDLRKEKEDIVNNLVAELNCFKIKKGDNVIYKGLPYKVQYIGKTKFGYRAQLRGSVDDFWTNVSDLLTMPRVTQAAALLKKGNSKPQANDKPEFEKDTIYEDWDDEIDDYLGIYDDDGLIPF